MTRSRSKSAHAGDIGAEIARRREAAGLTQRTLAARIGVSPSRVSDVENGRTRPTMRTLETFAAALRTTPSALLRSTVKAVAWARARV
jgi:transcriptional regulator with XRE-family HTH domain